MSAKDLPHYSSDEWVGAVLTLLHGGEQLEFEF